MIFEIDDHEVLPRPLWRELVLLRARHHCEVCGREPYGRHGLHAHHQDWKPSNHTLANGQALCPSCHGRAHAVDRMEIEVNDVAVRIHNKGVRPYSTSAGMLDHVRGKISSGKKLKHREYRAALTAMVHVPAELRPE